MALRLTFTDIGPIRRGTLEVAPLTILIGPNNSGKSVLSTLTYASIRAAQHLRSAHVWASFPDDPPGLPRRHPVQIPSPVLTLLRDTIAEGITSKTRIPDEVVSAISQINERFCRDYAALLTYEIERCFGVRAHTLVRRGPNGDSGSLSIKVQAVRSKWQIEMSFPQRRREPTVTVASNPPPRLTELRDLVDARYSRIADRWKVIPPEVLYGALLEVQAQGFLQDFPGRSFYLPAARSGFLQSHRALASAVVSRAPLVGIEDMHVAKFSGVIGDFIAQLLSLASTSRGEFSRQADLLENSVVDGRIGVSEQKTGYPDLWYGFHRLRLPLWRSSSMVSELAPVVLYLRHIVRDGDLLLIEEPESHLHPRSQILLAHVIGELVDHGLNILLTTHSDFFLSAIHNKLLASEVHGTPDSRLTMKATRAFICNSSRHGQGTRTQRLRLEPQSGISDEDFGKVAEQLYSETIKLENLLGEAR